MQEFNVQATSPAPDISKLDTVAAVKAMIEWFFHNFEDPAEETPYESAEGGYQWIWGGPYDAREELVDAFPDAPEVVLNMAIADVEEEGWEWAPSGRRIQEVAPEIIEEETGIIASDQD